MCACVHARVGARAYVHLLQAWSENKFTLPILGALLSLTMRTVYI